MSETNIKLTEEEIDELVIEQADNEYAWEETIYVNKKSRQIWRLFFFTLQVFLEPDREFSSPRLRQSLPRR